ncbi:MAG: UDP-3-O-(3-hydroxymyristoyl)glucosamine N-acyltransferase [Bacteroidetes bacterium]|nr:MAG: UDP-3-O-(3-hydroxymyristoyl)glucosamine N-acyltransferase [Bacteroidota bacterium]TAG87486.1 MAG: UDP-3-O-(3-hydroxymyristoyl)glucosamine N-acyltransferase [Bacteroidota bacterium]
MKFTIAQIAAILGGKVQGDENITVDKLGKIDESNLPEGSICFLSNMKYEHYIYTTNASVVIVGENFIPKNEIKNTNLIVVKDAYSGFTQLLQEYDKIITAQTLHKKIGIENPAFVASSAVLEKNVYVGAFAYIGENTKLGENVKIFPHVYIGENVIIEANTVLYSGVKVYPNTTIGKNCIFHSGVIIGAEGFGFAPQKDGSYKNIPQLGNVIIEDDVCIGANTTVDRATIGSTILKKGVKLDNLIQVGHNVEIGEHTVIAAQVGIAGSAKIGKYCAIGGQSGIAGHIEIANKTRVGGKTGVNATITEENTTVQGYPAQSYIGFMKSSALFRKLPELNKKIEELEKKLNDSTK